MVDIEIIDKTTEKLKLITDKSIEKGKIEEALAALSTLASLEYAYNQCYTDEYIENKIIELANTRKDKWENSLADINTVLFYDGFGLDTRGLVQIYLNALTKLKYKIIYITKAKDRQFQPQVMEILNNTNAVIYHLGHISYTMVLSKLREILSIENYFLAFFYTTPFDVTGAIAFRELIGRCRRYLINLTDHAFWVGRESVDYCIEFREYGASISHYHRGFKVDQLLELPFYPIINRNIMYQGFPDELLNRKVIFSGGALYKTIDESGTYYRIVESIIKRHPEIGFLYAGTGDDTSIKELVRKYPKQMFHICERNDLFEVLRHSYLYLNTYPISGALMLQYAAKASCIPVTLKREWDDDASGVLRYEEILGETFTDEKLIIQEIDKLIDDEEYKKKKESVLPDMIISEKEFTERLEQLIKNPVSSYDSHKLRKFDTNKYRDSFKQNFNKQIYLSHLINGNNKVLYKYFPVEVVKRAINKVRRCL